MVMVLDDVDRVLRSEQSGGVTTEPTRHRDA
jgi:hypothetical protein